MENKQIKSFPPTPPLSSALTLTLSLSISLLFNAADAAITAGVSLAASCRQQLQI